MVNSYRLLSDMAPHGKEMTTEQKEIVLQMSNAGFSSYKIQDVTDIQARTVQKFLKRVRERGSVENLPRSGRKRKTTVRDDMCLLRSIKKNRRQTLKDATNRFNTRTECGVSCRTIKRRLSENGYKRCVVSKKTTVSQINREKRSRFCRQRIHWTVDNQWSSIIFSDETKIVLGNNNKVYVWRTTDERLRPECLGLRGDRETTCKASIMFWGCVSSYGVGTLKAVDGNMNSEKYIGVLDECLWPVIVRHFTNRRWVFQEDNAPCHVSARSNEWKQNNDIETLPWPPQSPDLNIIENVWKVLKIRVQRRANEIRNADDLKHVVQDTWSNLPLVYIRSLYQSLPRRIRTVLRFRGHITKY